MLQNLINIFTLKKKKPIRLSYEDYIISSIIDDPHFEITAVDNIEIIKTFPIREGIQEEIALLITEGIEIIKNMPSAENLLEELTLVSFTNQKNERFAGLIYDAYDAWQEPVVIRIFRV